MPDDGRNRPRLNFAAIERGLLNTYGYLDERHLDREKRALRAYLKPFLERKTVEPRIDLAAFAASAASFGGNPVGWDPAIQTVFPELKTRREVKAKHQLIYRLSRLPREELGRLPHVEAVLARGVIPSRGVDALKVDYAVNWRAVTGR